MKKLKERWNVTSNWQLIIIFIVFAITGFSSLQLAKPFLSEFEKKMLIRMKLGFIAKYFDSKFTKKKTD
jgi:hypothetical protein